MKKTLVKVVSLICALAMVFSLAACGGKAPEASDNNDAKTEAPKADTSKEAAKEPVTLKLWSQFSDPKSTDGNFIAFYKSLDAIKTALPDIKIEHDGTEGEAYKTKIKTAMAANELPDIFFAWGAGFAEPMVKSGQVLPIDEYLNDGTLDKVVPGTMVNFTYDGKVYGLPYSIAVASLYCNKELFDANSVKLPETYEDLVAAVKTFSSKGITPIILGEKDLWPGLMPFGILAARSAGAQGLSDALSKKASFDTPEMLEAARKLKELSDLKAFGANAMGTSYNDSASAFKQGKGAMMYMGSWLNGDIEAEDSQVKGKVVPIKFPSLAGGKGNIDEFLGGSGETFMISAQTKQKEAAVKAVKFICENMSKEQFLAGSGSPAWKGDMGDTSKLNQVSVQVSELTKSAKGFVYWLDVMVDSKSAETIKNSIAQLISNKVTPEQFCKDLQKMNSAQ